MIPMYFPNSEPIRFFDSDASMEEEFKGVHQEITQLNDTMVDNNARSSNWGGKQEGDNQVKTYQHIHKDTD